MKTIGFIETKDNKIIVPKYIDVSIAENNILLDEEEKSKILNYLEKSNVVFAITLALFDEEKYIGSYMILSDGVWLWPSHFSYYLEKNNFVQLNYDFLDNIRSNFYIPPILDNFNKKEIEFFLKNSMLNLKKK